jgi:large subunit ribosomal protein L6
MSRTGKQPITIPDKVKVNLQDMQFVAEGPRGKESVVINSLAQVTVEDNQVIVKRVNDSKHARQVHGMTRALLNNAVVGVSEGFKRMLEINGVGYRADVKGKNLVMSLGYSHPIEVAIPEGLTVEVPEAGKIAVTGSNKEMVGQFASQIREWRQPEPYKGKGIKYAEETIIRKVGKAAGGK